MQALWDAEVIQVAALKYLDVEKQYLSFLSHQCASFVERHRRPGRLGCPPFCPCL